MQLGAKSRNGEICVSFFSKVYMFTKFHGSHLKISCIADGRTTSKQYTPQTQFGWGGGDRGYKYQ